MIVGLIARSEDRGLGNMTWAFHDHVRPARTLVIDMGPFAKGFAAHHDRYPDATIVPYSDGQLPEQIVRDWLAGLDVLYSAETFYDERLVGWARDAGVRTVLHVMPEFWRDELPRPDVVWAPTSWRLDTLPAPRLVPVPMSPPFAMPYQPWERDETLHVLHVAGNRAAADRNGTILAMNALRHLTERIDVRVETQGHRLPSLTTPPHVRVWRHAGGRRDRWALYTGADVLVLPRRYGGLCLPALEAMACGVPVLMPAVEPNLDWPIVPLDSSWRGTLDTPCGRLPLAFVQPQTIAAVLDRLARDGEQLAAARDAVRSWSAAHTWEALMPLYVAELERAAELPPS